MINMLFLFLGMIQISFDMLSLCAFKNYFASLTLFLRNFIYVFVITRFLYVHMPPLPSSLANTCDKEGKSWDLYVTIALGLKNLPLIHSYDSIQALNKSINKSERGHDLVIAVSCILLDFFLVNFPELSVLVSIYEVAYLYSTNGSLNHCT